MKTNEAARWENIAPILRSIQKLNDDDFLALRRHIVSMSEERNAHLASKINLGDVVIFKPTQKKYRFVDVLYVRVTSLARNGKLRGILVRKENGATKWVEMTPTQYWRVPAMLCKVVEKGDAQ